MPELIQLLLAFKGFMARIIAEASLVEIVTLLFNGVLLHLLREEKKDRMTAYTMAFAAQKESINIAERSLETTGKLAVIIESMKIGMRDGKPDV